MSSQFFSYQSYSELLRQVLMILSELADRESAHGIVTAHECDV